MKPWSSLAVLIAALIMLMSAPYAVAADHAATNDHAATAGPTVAGEQHAISAELDREAASWNRGDLDGYLSGYEHAATTMMIGKSALYRGWDAIAAMYRSHYGDRARMGRLVFGELEIHLLAPDYALVIGRWNLTRDEKSGGPAGGFFTLTFHRSAIGWRIMLDHTS